MIRRSGYIKRGAPPKRGGRINPRSKSDRRTLEVELDDLWKAIVAILAGGKCEKKDCKQPTWKPSAHHMIKCDHTWHRHEKRNGVYFCGVCHRWAEDHPTECRLWLQEHDPERYEYHMMHRTERSLGVVPMSLLEKWKADLSEELEELS